MARVQRVDAEFFRMSDAAVVQGADLPENGGDGTMALVNERVASQLRLGAAAVGARLVLEGSGPLTVAGVVRDNAPEGHLYQRLADADVATANILVRTSGPATTAVGPIRSAIAPLVTERTSATVATLREASTGMLQRLTGMALVVAALVLSLAGVGLYGSVAFITLQRTREIAIRMAIGAPRAAVLRMLLWEGTFVVLRRLHRRPGADRGRVPVHVGNDLREVDARSVRRGGRPRHLRRRHPRRMLRPWTPGIAHRADADTEGRVESRDGPAVRGSADR